MYSLAGLIEHRFLEVTSERQNGQTTEPWYVVVNIAEPLQSFILGPVRSHWHSILDKGH